MTLADHPVESWQAPDEPVVGGVPYERSAKSQIVVHYPGGHGPASAADVPQYLRNAQHEYLTDPDRGYSLGYNFAGAFGQVWGIRDRVWQCAANAGRDPKTDPQNPQSIAIIILVEGAAPADPATIARVRRLIADLRAAEPGPLVLVGHGDIDATACPGAGLRGQLDQLDQAPAPTPEVPDVETARLIRFRGFVNVFLIGAGPPLHLTQELVDSYTPAVPRLLLDPHPELIAQCLTSTGVKALTAGGPLDKF